MKYIIQHALLLTCICAHAIAHTQTLSCDWIHSFGSTNTEWMMDAAGDDAGNIVIGGMFYGEIDLDPSQEEHTISTTGVGGALYLAKYSDNGNLVWGFGMGKGNVLQVKCLPTGYILISGYYGGTCDFAPLNNEPYYLTSVGYDDAFVALYNADGILSWAKSIGGTTHSDKAWNCTMDNENNVYWSGYFIGSADLNPSAETVLMVNATGSTMSDVFVVKLSESGDFVWGGTIAGGGLEYGRDILVDSQQNLIIVGYGESSIDFALDEVVQIVNPAIGGSDMNSWIAKYSQDGELLSAKIFGGEERDLVKRIVETTGGYVVAGDYFGAGDFDPGDGELLLDTNGDSDIYILHLDESFNVIWSYTIGGSQQDSFGDIAIDHYGNIAVVGSFKETVDFDAGLNQSMITAHNIPFSDSFSDAFVMILNSAGEFKEVQRFGGLKEDSADGIAISGNKVILAGSFEANSSLNTCSVTATPNQFDTPDVFVLALSSDYLSIPNNEDLRKIEIYPNPTSELLNIQFPHIDKWQVSIYNMQGALVKEEQPKQLLQYSMEVQELNEGVYILVCSDGENLFTQQFIKH